MAYAIGFLLPIVGIGALVVFICKGLAEEAELNNYIKEHNKEVERRLEERNKKK